VSWNREHLLLPPPPPQRATAPVHPSIDVVREQRDGLVRKQKALSALVRQLSAQNASLREQLYKYQGYPTPTEQTDELVQAEEMEQQHGIAFHHLPTGVYPDKPFVTQQDLIRAGMTAYSRQSMSRLTRDDRSIPALLIADRVLLPPSAVHALLTREKAAVQDTSPRRRPGKKRRGLPPRT